MNITIDYKGWKIKAYKKVFYPPYPDFNASCYRKIGKRIFGFNVEGKSIKQVLNLAKERIDHNEFDVVWDQKLSKCVFE